MVEPALASSVQPAAPRRRRRGLRLAVAMLIALPLSLLAMAWALWHSEATLRWALGRLPGLLAEGVHGTLAAGNLKVDRLDWAIPGEGGRLRIEALEVGGLAFDWRPHEGAWIGLRAESVKARSLHVGGGVSPAAPLAAPTDLRSPIELRIARLAIGQVELDGAPALRGLAAQVHLGAERGASHRLDALSAEVERVRLEGSAVVGAEAPLPASASLSARSSSGDPWQGSLQADGPLARLRLRARLQGQAAAGAHAAIALDATAQLQPWSAWPLDALQIETHRFDLASLSDRLPATAIDGEARIVTRGLDLPARASAQLTNARPGRIDEGRLPVSRLELEASAVPRQPERVELSRLELQWSDAQGEAGRTTGRGAWNGDRLALELLLADLLPARIDARAAPLRIAGPLRMNVLGLRPPAGQALRPQVELAGHLTGLTLDGSGQAISLELDMQAAADQLQVRKAALAAGTARASLDGAAIREAAGWRLRGKAELQHFDPLPWWRGGEGTAWRRGPHRLDGRLGVDLVWHGSTSPLHEQPVERWPERVDGRADLVLDPSVLAGAALAGELHFERAGTLTSLRGDLRSAGNQLGVELARGSAAADDRVQLRVRAEAIEALAPLARLAAELWPARAAWLPSAGRAVADARLDGRWPALRGAGSFAAQGLRSAAGSVDSAKLDWRAEPGDGAEPSLSAHAELIGLQRNGHRLDRLEADASGTLSDHGLRWRVETPLRPPAWTESLIGPAGSGTRLTGEVRGSWQPTASRPAVWQLRALQLDGGARDNPAGRPWLQVKGQDGELQFEPGGALAALRLAPGRLALANAAVRWQVAEWQGSHAAVSAELEAIDIAALLQRLQPEAGWTGDLSLGGRIEIRSADGLDAEVVLERLRGDLQLVDESGAPQPLGLSELRLALGVHDGVWRFAQGLAGRQVGEMSGAQVIRPGPGQRWPAGDSPLQGVIEARVKQLGAWGRWLPPGWHLAGSLEARALFAGTAGAPEFSGRMTGRELGLSNVIQGVQLSGGEFDLAMDGDSARLERFRLRAGEGQLDVTGQASLGATPSAQLQLAAQRFQLLGRIDRRLVASGQAELKLDARTLALDGRLDIDEGLIDLSRGDAPELDKDVSVRQRGSATANGSARQDAGAPLPATLRNARIAMVVGLGERLKLRGRGIDTSLRGEVTFTSPGGRPSLEGVVRTAEGSYAAYGQNLELRRGVFTFAGALDDPRLDVLAVRPNLDVLVGVAVTGTAQLPRIRLYSDPEMVDADKLSWLLLGRGPEGLGGNDSALLQSAAVALLAGEGKSPNEQLMTALGLTQFSVRQGDGDTRDTIVSLGTQLSKNWYLGYERSLNSTTGTWQLIYRIAQRFTVRAQWGEDTSLDLIRSWRWN